MLRLLALLSVCAVLFLGFRASGVSDGDDVSDADRAAIQRSALVTLFTQREHAQQLLLWTDPSHESPSLQLLRDTRREARRETDRAVSRANRTGRDSLTASTPTLAMLSLPMRAAAVTLADLEAHFAAHPDAWEAWFTKYPASSGIVALTEPVLRTMAGERSPRASLIVARTCGEHCHSAWRVELRRDDTGRWRTLSVQPLALRPD